MDVCPRQETKHGLAINCVEYIMAYLTRVREYYAWSGVAHVQRIMYGSIIVLLNSYEWANEYPYDVWYDDPTTTHVIGN